MTRLPQLIPVVLVAGMVVVVVVLAAATPAAAHDVPSDEGAPPGEASPAGSTGDVTTATTGADDAEEQSTRLKWHGSTLSFDQSVTTQTVHLGADFQSYDPTYEWWIAFKPRYYLHESRTNTVSVNFWANLYLELTNSDTTTRLREPLFGPSYLWATYAHNFYPRVGYKTTLSIGPRATIPTDKAARNVGQIIGLGGIGGVSQAFPLRGHQARLGLNVFYNHPFSRATSGINSDIQQLRQDVLGQTFISDQLTGGMLVKNAMNIALSGDLRLTRRLELSLSYVWLNAWTYAPAATCVDAFPACVSLPADDPVTYRVSTWVLASLDYDVIDDLTVEVGYYNLAEQIGPDGTRRNPLWSPNARLFVTLVGKLDALYERLAHKTRN